jgi:hypothetical protein
MVQEVRNIASSSKKIAFKTFKTVQLPLFRDAVPLLGCALVVVVDALRLSSLCQQMW